MAKRTCEICGRPTAEADFSKSYKRRCKECVARETREARARTKTETPDSLLDIGVPGTILDDQPDWEQRRYDVALTIFLNEIERGQLSHIAARKAKEAADQFINEIREDEP